MDVCCVGVHHLDGAGGPVEVGDLGSVGRPGGPEVVCSGGERVGVAAVGVNHPDVAPDGVRPLDECDLRAVGTPVGQLILRYQVERQLDLAAAVGVHQPHLR